MDSNSFLSYLGMGFLLPWLNTIFNFAWGASDNMIVTYGKRFLLLLPIASIVGSYWLSLVGGFTLIFRSERQKFIRTLLITWWDLGRAVSSFWAGFFRFGLQLAWTAWGAIRFTALSLWVFTLDLLSLPIKVLGNFVSGIANPSLPWIAVGLTFVWCVFEAGIFTFVTTPLVQDTLSNLTGSELSEKMLRAPLFLFMLFIVLGSYAILATWTDTLKNRDWMGMVKIGAIEAVAIGVEVVFLYREFVDALVPWFAQYSAGKFEIGIFGILSIASATWFGIRSLSWFLFASSGTPTIMAIIQGTGLKKRMQAGKSPTQGIFATTLQLFDQLKKEEKWLRDQGEKLVASVVLPPLQLVAAVINFGMVVFQAKHMFELPFQNLSDIKDAKNLLEEKTERRREAA